MAVLVTGGAGYIGSHTVAELMERGQEVVVVDDLRKGHREAVLVERFYEGDVGDAAVLDRIFTENRIDAVLHFAAFSLVGESVTEPLKYYQNNVGAAMQLVSAMHRHEVKHIVFSSTAATYGNPTRVPLREDDPTIPTNPYGETKLAIEKMLRWCDPAYGLRSICLRYFNAAGAHPTLDIGEDHSPETHLIPVVMQVALGQRPHLSIFGDDYDTPDGTCVRDYIHVVDLANAHWLALEKLRAGAPSGVYNLGTGSGFSVREVVEKARTVTGAAIPVVTGPRRAGDPGTLIASSDRAREELGWRPQRENLDDIIASAWKWHRGHPQGFRRQGSAVGQ